MGYFLLIQLQITTEKFSLALRTWIIHFVIFSLQSASQVQNKSHDAVGSWQFVSHNFHLSILRIFVFIALSTLLVNMRRVGSFLSYVIWFLDDERNFMWLKFC